MTEPKSLNELTENAMKEKPTGIILGFGLAKATAFFWTDEPQTNTQLSANLIVGIAQQCIDQGYINKQRLLDQLKRILIDSRIETLGD